MSKQIELELVPVVACPLCGGSDSQMHDEGTDTLMPEINRYLPSAGARLPEDMINSRVRCVRCGLIYLSPRLNANSLTQLYGLWYGFAYKRVMNDPAHVQERQHEFRHYHLRYLEHHQPSRGRLLDVGCGSGLFMDIARQNGWQVSGVELDAATAAWGREQLGLPDLRGGVLSDVLLPGETFDAITLFDYLEHTDRPGADLDLLVQHLAKGGVLMIRVPNSSGWQARLMGPRWLAIMPTHLSYFTPEVLRDALTDRGLTIEYQRAGNYRTQSQILRQRVHWLAMRLGLQTPRAAAFEAGATTLPLPDSGKLLGAGFRWLRSLWIEQIDHIGGWFGEGNNLTMIARRR